MKPFKKSTSSFILLAIAALATPKVLAASCCGGGVSGPGLIMGDESTQFSSSYSRAKSQIDVSSQGYWQKRSDLDQTETLRLEGSSIFPTPLDRFQAGFSLPLVQRTQAGAQGSGLGDISLSSAYEFLPDWDYNPWRPKGIGFLSVIVPSGKSIYDGALEEPGGALGKGLWTLSLGTVFLKSWTNWDGSLQGEIHQPLARRVNSNGLQGEIRPGPGGSFGGGVGYSYGKYRMGSSLIWNYDEPIHFQGVGEYASWGVEPSVQRSATFALSLTRSLENYASLALSYSDQSWFGAPVNSTLSQTFQLTYQKRWLR